MCLTPEVRRRTFQEKGVVNGAITAGDQRKVTSNQTKQSLGWGCSSVASVC